MAAFPLAIVGLALLLLLLPNTALPLELHFYRKSCPKAEIIVKSVVKQHFQKDPSIAAGLIRLYFHDCFVRGCDGSVLIDSTDDSIAEKESPPNLTLRGFEVIDDVKAALEAECRGTVSCADALALATRDSVALSGGAAYALPTGRRDGTVSNAAEVHVPGPSFTVSAALAAFQNISLSLVDLTTLLGAHSVGHCHCGFFIDRLYNFRGTGTPDPAMDPGLVSALKQRCPPSTVTLLNISKDPTVPMNQETAAVSTLDGSFFRSVLGGKALLKLDQDLASTDVTNAMAVRYAKTPRFFVRQFSKSMVNLGSVGVLTGQEGEIRLNCRRTNNDTSN